MSSKMDAVQELKSERVQEETMAAEKPLVLWLKSERVQEPGARFQDAVAQSASMFELVVNPCQTVTVGLQEMQVTITLEGLLPGSNAAASRAGQPQSA